MSSLFKIHLNTKTKLLLSTAWSNSLIYRHNTAIQKPGLNLCYFTFSREISAKTYTGCYYLELLL